MSIASDTRQGTLDASFRDDPTPRGHRESRRNPFADRIIRPPKVDGPLHPFGEHADWSEIVDRNSSRLRRLPVGCRGRDHPLGEGSRPARGHGEILKPLTVSALAKTPLKLSGS